MASNRSFNLKEFFIFAGMANVMTALDCFPEDIVMIAFMKFRRWNTANLNIITALQLLQDHVLRLPRGMLLEFMYMSLVHDRKEILRQATPWKYVKPKYQWTCLKDITSRCPLSTEATLNDYILTLARSFLTESVEELL